MTAPSSKAKPAPVTRIVADWLAKVRHDDVPQKTRHAIRLLITDTLGAAVAGFDQPWTKSAAAWIERGALTPGGKGLATVWGERHARFRPCDAALVNGIAAHAFELDDFNAKLHPGAVVIPAAMALAEARGCDGARLETAIAAGYEVMIRTSLALDPNEGRLRGWHLTGVCGTYGAAAAASIILGLDAERTAWALGLAGTQSGGLFAFNADGSMSKRLHPGRSAMAGIMAAEFAELGFTGPSSIYETEDGGFLWAYSPKSRTEPLIDGLGKTWHTDDTNFKPHACCGSLHSHVDCAVALRPRWKPGLRVRAGVAEVVNVQCGYPYEPGSELNAQMSIRYCVAAALLDGAALPAQFTPERIADPAVTKLAQSLEVVHEPAHDKLYPAHYCGWVEIEKAPGSNAFERMERIDPSGHFANPDRDASLLAKFATLVPPVLGKGNADALAAKVQGLDRARANEIVSLLARA